MNYYYYYSTPFLGCPAQPSIVPIPHYKNAHDTTIPSVTVSEFTPL